MRKNKSKKEDINSYFANNHVEENSGPVDTSQFMWKKQDDGDQITQNTDQAQSENMYMQGNQGQMDPIHQAQMQAQHAQQQAQQQVVHQQQAQHVQQQMQQGNQQSLPPQTQGAQQAQIQAQHHQQSQQQMNMSAMQDRASMMAARNGTNSSEYNNQAYRPMYRMPQMPQMPNRMNMYPNQMKPQMQFKRNFVPMPQGMHTHMSYNQNNNNYQQQLMMQQMYHYNQNNNYQQQQQLYHHQQQQLKVAMQRQQMNHSNPQQQQQLQQQQQQLYQQQQAAQQKQAYLQKQNLLKSPFDQYYSLEELKLMNMQPKEKVYTTIGYDHKSFGLGIHSSEDIHKHFHLPWHKHPLIADSPPNQPDYLKSKQPFNPALLERLDHEILFYIVHALPMDPAMQIGAIQELLKRRWHYDKDQKFWFSTNDSIQRDKHIEIERWDADEWTLVKDNQAISPESLFSLN